MTKENFIQMVSDRVQASSPVPGVHISWDIFTKNNNTKKYGIIIRQGEEETVFPTVYVDCFYDDYLRKKMTIDEITLKIWEVIEQVKERRKKYDSLSLEWEDCKDFIYYRLISQKKNREWLQGIPHLPFLDLAIVFGVVCNQSEQGVETLIVHNALMELWGVTVRDLFQASEENTPRLFPYQSISLFRMLSQYLEIPEEEDISNEDVRDERKIQVLSNSSGVNGASVILYPGVIESVAKEYDSNLCILPSSIHEVIVVPAADESTASELSSMVKEINEKHVSREEVLSDHAYFYDRKKKKFSV